MSYHVASAGHDSAMWLGELDHYDDEECERRQNSMHPAEEPAPESAWQAKSSDQVINDSASLNAASTSHSDKTEASSSSICDDMRDAAGCAGLIAADSTHALGDRLGRQDADVNKDGLQVGDGDGEDDDDQHSNEHSLESKSGASSHGNPSSNDASPHDNKHSDPNIRTAGSQDDPDMNSMYGRPTVTAHAHESAGSNVTDVGHVGSPYALSASGEEDEDGVTKAL